MGTEEEETFNVEINTVTGKRISLPCKSSDTVGDMKEKLAEQLECPTDCLKIVKGAKMLKDDVKTLADYGIEGPIKLKAIVRLMNVITPERIRGNWIWVCFGGKSSYRFSITGDPIRTKRESAGNGSKVTITENGFGFGEDIYKPKVIHPNLSVVRFTRYNSDDPGNTSFWVKKIDEKVLDELSEAYGFRVNLDHQEVDPWVPEEGDN